MITGDPNHHAITTAKIGSDGNVVEVLADGSERAFPKQPMRAMTEADIEAAAAADPDARPVTEDELKKARRIPRIKTLRRALGLTQEDLELLGPGNVVLRPPKAC